MIFAIIFFSILILFAAVISLPFKLGIYYENGRLRVKLFILSLKINLLSPEKKHKEETKSKASGDDYTKSKDKFVKDTEKATVKIKRFIKIFKRAVIFTKKYINADEISAKIVIGSGDAAVTAIATGALYGVIYSLLGALALIVNIEKPEVEITPDYSQQIFKSDCHCIISSRIVYIILIMIQILLKWKQISKEEQK